MALPRICIRKNQNGFSLIEILIVLAMFAIIGTLVIPLSVDAYHNYGFRNEQELLLSLLQKARSQSMTGINQASHGVHIDPILHQYILFQGTDYNSRDTSFDLISEASSNFTFGGLGDIIFDQLSVKTIPGFITLDDHVHPLTKIILNNEGQINLQ